MKIRRGVDEEHKEVELDRTEARAAGRGYNIYVLIFGLGGAVIAFLVIYLVFAQGL